MPQPLTPRYSDGPAGFELFGTLADADRELLLSAYEESLKRLSDDWTRSIARRQTFWINLWQRSGGGKVPLDRIEEVDRFSRGLVDAVYGPDRVVFDGYGWIVNPAGSQTQEWHIDYTLDYSTIFIPLSRLTEHNCLQYVVLPVEMLAELKTRAATDLDKVDLDLLCRESEWVSIRQLIAKPFSILKIDFETIHRGVANAGGFDRVVFWISVKKTADLVPMEPLVERIEE